MMVRPTPMHTTILIASIKLLLILFAIFFIANLKDHRLEHY